MSLTPPITNLLVIRSANVDRAVTFYEQIGLHFVRHSHGKGPEHYASESCGFVFEIYPERNPNDQTVNIRFGFTVDNVDGVLERLKEVGAIIVSAPAESEWGRRAVVKDFDGHTIELVTSPDPNTRDRQMQSSEWFDVVGRSGLVDSETLVAYTAQFSKGASALTIASQMIADDVLTRWQASMLRKGKWKGYFVDHYRLMNRRPDDTLHNLLAFDALDTRSQDQVILEVKCPSATEGSEAIMNYSVR